MKMNLKTAGFILAPVVAAGAMNGAIYALGWNRNSQKQRNPLLPPGWAVGTIWVVLLSLLGYTSALAYNVREFALLGSFIALILTCLAYPLYTRGLRPEYGNLGNTISLIFAFSVAIHAALRLPKTLWFLSPLLVWVSYVRAAT